MGSAIRIIKVPDVGEGIAEVELVVWHVEPGQSVAEDQPLADMMTDKAAVEIPSPVAGRVLVLGGEVGQMLAVGSELIRIEVSGAPAAAVQPPAAGKAATTPPAAVAVAASAAAAQTATPPRPPDAARPAAADAPAIGSAAPGVAAPPPLPMVNRPIASPAVRRRAWELGIDLKDVPPSGAAGRILQVDLDRALAAGVEQAPFASAPAMPRPQPAPKPSPSTRVPAPGAPVAALRTAAPTTALRPALAEASDDVQTIPVIGLRRRIAMRMQEAKRRIPHFSYVEELDVTALEALRASLNTRHAATRGHLTVLPLLMRAIVLALAEFPQINALFDDDAGVITRHSAVHLGVATQTPQGLLVPVVRHAQTLDPWGLAAQVQRLADAARAGKSTREDLSGSTITISSLGALGGIASTPVINRPEVAIVGVNRIVERPMLRDGDLVNRLTMNLSSSFDHRVVDGDDAARFIQAVRLRIEQPVWLFAD